MIGALPTGRDQPRILGRYDTGEPGPAIVVVVGIHGNEPAGVTAVGRVLHALTERGVPVRGSVVAVLGNRAALAARRRFVQQDLNRMWTRETVAQLRVTDTACDGGEAGEQRELLATFDHLLAPPRSDVVVVDLHSTSAPSPPFACFSDTLASRAVARATALPLILGLEEAIRGTLLDYLEDLARPAVLVEGGQHDDPASVRHLEATLWRILVHTGLLEAAAVPDFPEHEARLSAAVRALPRVVEVVYRHAIADTDAFRMRPGFGSFRRVRRGDVLADDRRGPVAAPVDGLLLMPLYQDQGNDGFFIGRPVRRSWLSVSRIVRILRGDRLLPSLPGIARDPDRPHRLLVDTRVARWFPRQVFHLAGFRQLPPRDGKLVFTRRVEV